MERREAVKSIGLGSAALFTSSLFMGTLQSCTSAPYIDWSPVYLSPYDALRLEKICEAIMPKSDTPGATDAQVVQHIDQTLKVLTDSEDAEYLRKGLSIFVNKYESKQGADFEESTTEQITEYINGLFKIYDENPEMMREIWQQGQEEGEKSKEFLEVYFVNNITDATIRSYFTSEIVGETVMRYDPVPVKYEGCIPYSSGEKSWASV